MLIFLNCINFHAKDNNTTDVHSPFSRDDERATAAIMNSEQQRFEQWISKRRGCITVLCGVL